MTTPSWLQTLLTNKEVSDICINGGRHVFIDRGTQVEFQSIQPEWKSDELKSWVIQELSQVGITWDARFPFVDGTLLSGHRIHVAFPTQANRPTYISLRRTSHCPLLEQELPSHGDRWEQRTEFESLVNAFRNKETLLISGATGSGKTTLATDLISGLPDNERIIALEDTPELSPRHPHFISLVSRNDNSDGFGGVTLRDLLRQTLRMRPDRIILGECRGDETLELLQVLNTGHGGALATLHANSPKDALRRVELLCLLASQGTIPVPVIRELLAVGVRWLVHLEHRKIKHICRIEGREGDTILLRPMLEYPNGNGIRAPH